MARPSCLCFHELLDYRWRLSEVQVLRNVPDERTAIVTEARDGGPEL